MKKREKSPLIKKLEHARKALKVVNQKKEKSGGLVRKAGAIRKELDLENSNG